MRLPVILIAAAALCGANVAAASGGGSGAADGASLVAMEPLDVAIIDGGRPGGRLRLRLVLGLADADAAARATAALPRLRAAALAATVDFAGLYASPLAPVDAGRLSKELNTALHHADPGVTRVLIVEVSAVRT